MAINCHEVLEILKQNPDYFKGTQLASWFYTAPSFEKQSAPSIERWAIETTDAVFSYLNDDFDNLEECIENVTTGWEAPASRATVERLRCFINQYRERITKP